MGRSMVRMGRNKDGSFVWEYKGGLIHLHGHEIYYLHSQQRKIFIHTARHVYEIGGKLDEAEQFLQELPLVRTHYSYLVHIRYLDQVRGKEVILKNGEQIPISKSCRKQVYDKVFPMKSSIA